MLHGHPFRVNATEFARRRFLNLAAGAAAVPAASRIARAQTYPARPVRIVVPYPAGIAPDIVSRLVANSLSQQLGQQFIVDNRPGGASNIGTELVVRAPPDGYTLLAVTMTNTINPALYDNLSFDILRDIAPVSGLGPPRSQLLSPPRPPVSGGGHDS